jgi:WD40 repeat protein
VQDVAFSPDGKLVLSATDDGGLRLTDTLTGKRRADLSSEGNGAASALAVRGDGRLAVGYGNRLALVDLRKIAP